MTEKKNSNRLGDASRKTGQRSSANSKAGANDNSAKVINALLDSSGTGENIKGRKTAGAKSKTARKKAEENTAVPTKSRTKGARKTNAETSVKTDEKSSADTRRKTSAGKKTPSKAKETKAASANNSKRGRNGREKDAMSSKRTRKDQILKIIPLGGLGEIGKNLTVYEYKNDIIIVDCGLSFPSDEMLGIDIVIPDFTYLENNADKIRGMIITHGHEDHIGAIPYLLKKLNIPIFATPLTLGLIKCKLTEHKLLSDAKLNPIHAGERITLGAFAVEAINVNHSIPDAVAFCITTPVGVVVQTGDFKIDTTPINGETIDLARFAALGKKGVLALLMDSTNATRPGFTPSERTVGYSFSHLFKGAEDKRIIVASFSSNIHRIQQIIDEAVRCGRKVCVIGRSMENAVSVAAQLGYLNVPDGVLISADLIKRYAENELVIITTGSQGEPMSALHRMAFGEHRKVKVGPGDLIIVSATPIPGNEKLVTTVINELLKLGAQVIYDRMYDVHVSGHACQEELKLMLSLVKPKFFIPVHGEQMHLSANAELGRKIGVDPKNILITEIGTVIELTSRTMRVGEKVPSGAVLVDGLGVGDVGSVVLRDRKHLAEDGIIVAAMTVDSVTGELIYGPELISRGFVYVKESEELLEEARERVSKAAQLCTVKNPCDWPALKNTVKDALSSFLFERTRRDPMVLPVIMQI